jgi:hypothetical protein
MGSQSIVLHDDRPHRLASIGFPPSELSQGPWHSCRGTPPREI